MKTYEITCEGMVSRTITVNDAFCLVGAREEDVEIADIYSEPVKLKEVSNEPES